MPKFDVKIELLGKLFLYRDVPAETMDDACIKATTRAQRSINVVSVAPSSEVRPNAKASNASQLSSESFMEMIFGRR